MHDDKKVVFTISNKEGAAPHSSITGVYWADSGHLLSNPAVENKPGVSFTVGGSPANLPGVQSADFAADFSVTNIRQVANGINPGESLQVTFTLPDSTHDILSTLNSGDLRVGLFVQSPSGSFVSEPISPGLMQAQAPDSVPEPSTVLLLGTGLGVIGYFVYWRYRKTATGAANSH